MGSKYKIVDHQALHFLSFATVQWVDALTRPTYKDVIVKSLQYCQNEKGLVLYAWVIMTNHVHLIASAKEGYNLSDIIQDRCTVNIVFSHIESSLIICFTVF